jgi:hypothetical protein
MIDAHLIARGARLAGGLRPAGTLQRNGLPLTIGESMVTQLFVPPQNPADGVDTEALIPAIVASHDLQWSVDSLRTLAIALSI